MTKDNHLLGKFDLTGIAPAPRGIPQIEVIFEIDENRILQVSAEDKASGKSQKITIREISPSLIGKEIDKIIREVEEFAEEDKKVYEIVIAEEALDNNLLRNHEHRRKQRKFSRENQRIHQDNVSIDSL